MLVVCSLKTNIDDMIKLCMFLTLQAGKAHATYGPVPWAMNLVCQKDKFFDSANTQTRLQVTKSCHWCQNQHITNTCMQPGCTKSYCSRWVLGFALQIKLRSPFPEPSPVNEGHVTACEPYQACAVSVCAYASMCSLDQHCTFTCKASHTICVW